MTRYATPTWIALGVVLTGLPVIGGDFYVNLASQIFIAAIFAASLNLLVGYGGLVSLGHASWIGLADVYAARPIQEACPSDTRPP